MLIRFSVTNFLSFHEEVTLDMIPAKGARIMKDHEIVDETGKKVSALPLAAIYGANASGKTNLIKALAFMRNFVVQAPQSKTRQTGVKPFLLAEKQEPARFEIVFKHKEVVYTYGFVVSEKAVEEEWLFAYFSSNEARLFERKRGQATEFGDKMKQGTKAGILEFLAETTNDNRLFLSEAYEKNVSIAEIVHSWFLDKLVIIKPKSIFSNLEILTIKDNDFCSDMGKLLVKVDKSIINLRGNREDFIPEKHLSFIPPDIRSQLLDYMDKNPDFRRFLRRGKILFKENDGEPFVIQIQTIHKRSDGQEIAFDLDMASDGTHRFMNLAPIIMELNEIDIVYVIDELDLSLHTQLSLSLIRTFLDKRMQVKSQNQMIFTTHDTNLLDRNMLRRDEIWFMEKDKIGASHITSLSEFKLSDKLNIEKGYLNGRFGAIPFHGNMQKLLN